MLDFKMEGKEISIEDLKILYKNRVLEICNFINKDLKDKYRNMKEIESILDEKTNNLGIQGYGKTRAEFPNRIYLSQGDFRKLESYYRHAYLGYGNEDFYRSRSYDKNYNETNASYYYKLSLGIALDYLILHELAHFYQGHLEYKETKRLNEIQVENEIIKMFEWNADDFSTSYLIKHYTFDETIEDIKKQCDERVLKYGKFHMLMLLMDSVITVSSVFDIGKKDKNVDKEHIPSRIRLIKNIKNLIGVYNLYNNDADKVLLDETIYQFINQVENGVNDAMNQIHDNNVRSIYNNLEEFNSLNEVDEIVKKYEEVLNDILKDYVKLKKNTTYIDMEGNIKNNKNLKENDKYE